MNRSTAVLACALSFGLIITACDSGPTSPEASAESSVEATATTNQSGNAAPRSGETFSRPMWGNDHLWEFLAPKPIFNPAGKLVFGSPSDESSHQPFYVIGSDAGDDGAQSRLFFGDHDHVASVPPGNKGTFNANWHIQVVIPADSKPAGTDLKVNEDLTIRDAFLEDHDMNGNLLPKKSDVVYAVKYEGDNSFTDLTSHAKVQKAIDQGLVDLILSPEVFVCPVRDIEG